MISLRKLEGVRASGLSGFKSVIAKVHYFTEGPCSIRAAREVIELARHLGINLKTLERARVRHGIVTSVVGKDAGWMWQ